MQVVGYETAFEEPAALAVAAGGTVHREELARGTELGYRLGERRCAGRREGGDHVACGRPEVPYCPEHTSRWPCARCRGNCNRPVDACREEHAVYLAAFAPDRFKVGVTRSWRLERRLNEQGADRGAHVYTVPDGRRARCIEADIAATVGDSVRVADKITGFARPLDSAAWSDLLADFAVIDEYTFDYGLSLERGPVPATLAAGTVRGSKGRVLLLERAGTVYAVDMRELVGHELERGPSRARQSSLGAF